MYFQTTTPLEGFLFINKPKNISSFHAVYRIKKLLNQKIKIGHTGTLDPFATGLLIIAIGRNATKLIPSFMNLDKEYIFTAKLGELTSTLDYTGTILSQKNSLLTNEQLEAAIKSLGTTYRQIPPIFSALKHQGQPLYKLALKKNIFPEKLQAIVEEKQKTVTIHTINLVDYTPPFFTINARVSKGTYIRSLANDIAQKVGSYATTYELTRTHIGPISLAKAITLDTLQTSDDISHHVVSIDTVIPLIQGVLS